MPDMLYRFAGDDGVEAGISMSNCLNVHYLPSDLGEPSLQRKCGSFLDRRSGKIGGHDLLGQIETSQPTGEPAAATTNFQHSLAGQIAFRGQVSFDEQMPGRSG
jgi:hypothetical protein